MTNPPAVLQMQRLAGNRAVSAWLHGAGSDSVPARRQEALGAGPDLLKLVEEVEATLGAASNLEAGVAQGVPVQELDARLRALREIAVSGDEATKRETLEAVLAELDAVGLVPQMEAMRQGPPLQRVRLPGGAVAVVTVGLGYLAWRVYEYIQERFRMEREELERWEDENLEEYRADRYEVDTTPAAIPSELLAGISRQRTVGAKAGKLFSNMNRFRFRYKGRFVGAWAALKFRQGDCQTLTDIYLLVAGEAGIAPCTRKTLNGPLIVERRPIHGRSDLTNDDDGTCWYFDEHYWIDAAGTDFDLLFMTSPSPRATVSDGLVESEGVTYYTFPDGREAMTKWHNRGAPIDEVKVFPNHDATVRFLEEHRSPDGTEWRGLPAVPSSGSEAS